MRPTCATLIALAALSLSPGCQEAAPAPNIGYVETDWLYVAAPESGRVVAQPIREGARVAVGDILVELDRDAQEAAVEEARARLEQLEAEARDLASGARAPELSALEAHLREAEARRTRAAVEVERLGPLVAEGIATAREGDLLRADLDAANAAVEAGTQDLEVARLAARPAHREAAAAAIESAAAALRDAEYRLDQRTLRAQRAGRVEEVFFAEGEFANAGQPLLALVPDDATVVRFFVPQAKLPNIALGAPVRVVADGRPSSIEAVVSFIAAEAEYTPPVIYSKDVRDKLVFRIEARLPAGSGLHAGLPVELSW